MRITYRNKENKNYWEERWSNIETDTVMQNESIYPLKYALKMISKNDGRILEAGCGAGRILKYFHNKQHDIIGIDFIANAIKKLKTDDTDLKVFVDDIKSLKFNDEYFKYILAFGLFHNLDQGLKESINESHRVLEKGGSICVSFRADNIQTKIVDFLEERKQKDRNKVNTIKFFHKMNLTKTEFKELFHKAGFEVKYIKPVENMPILYKFSFFRHRSHKIFNENLARKEGYKLSWYGFLIQKSLMTLMPYQFCNIYVLIAKKS